MTFRQLYNELDKMFPKSLSCEWDNDGIMCMPNPDSEVKNVLISLDITEDVVDFAIKNGFDTIISHHPLVFSSQKSLSIDNYTQRKLIKLVKSNINAISLHTRLDAGNGGVNDTLCKLLDFENTVIDPLDPVGRIATLDSSIDIETFAKEIKQKLNSPCVFYNGTNKVQKVYLCGGDGKDMIPLAIANGADTLLTGRVSYNSMIDAYDMGLNIIEAGHFYTENPVCNTLESIILNIDNTLKIERIISTNIKILK